MSGWSNPAMRTPCALDLGLVFVLLSSGKFDLSNEKATQAGIEGLLLQHIPAAQVSREHRLAPGDIPDFLLGGTIVVEVKGPRHRGPDVIRQIERYALHPQVEAIIVATARAMRLPNSFRMRDGRQVPVLTLNLGKAWL